MKKVIIILAIATLICLMVSTTAFASETDTPNEDTNVNGEENSVEKFYSSWLDNITDSTMWINLATNLAGLVASIAYIKSIADSLKKKIGLYAQGQLSRSEIADIISDAIKGAIDAYKEESDKHHLEQIEKLDNERTTIISIMTIFFTNAKINSYAKNEILKLLANAENISGSIEEIVNVANSIINETIAAEDIVSTPALDIVANVNTADNYVVGLG